MSAHTLGPWRTYGREIIGDSRLIATVYWCSGLTKEDRANLHLIAAAPELLAALRTLRSLLNEGSVPRYSITPGAALNSFVEEVLDPAIRKAEGR